MDNRASTDSSLSISLLPLRSVALKLWKEVAITSLDRTNVHPYVYPRQLAVYSAPENVSGFLFIQARLRAKNFIRAESWHLGITPLVLFFFFFFHITFARVAAHFLCELIKRLKKIVWQIFCKIFDTQERYFSHQYGSFLTYDWEM